MAIIEKFKKTGTIKNLKRTGRPKITTKAEDRNLIVSSKRDRFKTAPILAAEFNKGHERKISVTTVKRRLIKTGLNGRVAAKKPLLRPKNIKLRKQYAEKYLHWTSADWSNVLFTDESKYEIFGSKRRTFVRRFKHEKYAKYCIKPTVKHAGGSVMVWGCFCAAGVGDLVEVSGKMLQGDYQKNLRENAESSGFRLIGAGFKLQQDNDPKHTAINTTIMLKKKQRQGKVYITLYHCLNRKFERTQLSQSAEERILFVLFYNR